jgi:hypothetical protein
MSARKAKRRATAQKDKLPAGFTPTPIFAAGFIDSWLADIGYRGIDTVTALASLRHYPFSSREVGGHGTALLQALATKLALLVEDVGRLANDVSAEHEKLRNTGAA